MSQGRIPGEPQIPFIQTSMTTSINRALRRALPKEMNESILKSEQCAHFREKLLKSIVVRHEDQSMVGIPDITVTWRGFTSWIEVKHAKPAVRTKHGLQKELMCRFADQGKAFYIIFAEVKDERRTFLVPPAIVRANQWTFDLPHVAGFDYQYAVERILETHK